MHDHMKKNIPDLPITLADLLVRRANTTTGITFIEGDQKERFVSYHELLDKATQALNNLTSWGIAPEHEVLLLVESNEDFLTCFWACILGGIIPVPLSVGGQEEHRRKVMEVVSSLSRPIILADDHTQERVKKYYADAHSEVPHILSSTKVLSDDSAGPVYSGPPMRAQADSIAYIQYSSGSTGKPKGVVLTHENLVANISDIVKRSEVGLNDKALSWMPLTHDMGLICFHLASVYAGINQYIMPTALFIRRPVLWIEKAHQHRITQLYSPNFGVRYFLSSYDNHKGKHWDLSSIRIIYNGAEPIDATLCLQFTDQLADCGIKANVFYPGYGLAEASVAVCLPNAGDSLVVYYLDRKKLNIGQRIVPVDASTGVGFVEVGYPMEQCRLRIADQEGRPLSDGHIGEIQIKGKNVTRGYYNQPSHENPFTQDGWLATGDLGFVWNKRLVVTGRIKNVIILNGQNYYPQDVERIACELDFIEAGKVVACSSRLPVDGKELLLLFVLHKGDRISFEEKARQLHRHIATRIGLMVGAVIPLQKIPKTTSGKIQHTKLQQLFEEGAFEKSAVYCLKTDEASATWLQDVYEVLHSLFPDRKFDLNKDIFSQGLSSLEVMQATARLSENKQFTVSLSDVFRNPVFSSYADAPLNRNPEDQLLHAPSDKYYRLHPDQERIWLFDLQGIEPQAYNISLAIKIQGMLDTDQMSEAFDVLVQRHEALRTRIVDKDGVPFMKISNAPDTISAFQFIDLTHREDDSDTIAQSLVYHQANEPFVIGEVPLVRAMLVKTDALQYVCCITMHHIVSDGHSLLILMREWLTQHSRTNTHLPSIDFQYKDYVFSKLRAETNKKFRQDRSDYFSTIEHQPLAIDFGQGNRPKPTHSWRGDAERHTVESERLRAITAFAARENKSLFTFLFSLVSVLLYKYTGQTEMVIGTVISGRNRVSVEGIVGNLINTLCIPIVVNPALKFHEYMQETHKSICTALSYEHCSFSALLDAFIEKNKTSQASLFNVLILFQNMDFENLFNITTDLRIQRMDLKPPQGTYSDLTFEFIQDHDGLTLWCRYNPDLVDRLLIRQIIESFEALLEVIVIQDKKLPIAAYSASSDRQLHEIKNNIYPTEPTRSHFLDMWKASVASFATLPAVTVGTRAISYKDLDTWSTLFAQWLIYEQDLKPGASVIISLERSQKFVIAILGVIKAGMCYIPVDLDFPLGHLETIYQDSGAALVIGEISTESIQNSSIPKVWEWSDFLDDVASGNVFPDFEWIVDTTGLAYIIYTSGSTGKPKGVQISHASLADYAWTFCEYFQLGKEDRIIHQSSISFDTHIEEIFPILLAGGCIVIAQEGGRDIDSLATLIDRARATILTTTPHVIDALNKSKVDFLHSLRVLISGGDVLRGDNISNIPSGIALYNSYGPSESTVCATYHRIDNINEASLLGTPIRNRSIFILDQDRQLVPHGGIGEICIGGTGLMNGYLGEQGDIFIDHSFDKTQKLYPTGDMGKWNENGVLEFLGRKDFQVKIRGHRVEPSTLQHCLLRHSNIESAFVVADKIPEARLIAYVKTRNGFSVPQIRGYLKKQLPVYLQPSEIFEIESVPYTVQGKVDMNMLRNRVLAREENEKDDIGPELLTLANLWKEILGIDRICSEDDFFEKGGHSILATKMLSRVTELFGVRVSFRIFLENSSLRSLSNLLNVEQRDTFTPIKPLAELPYYIISPFQNRLWIEYELGQDPHPYQLQWVYEIDGSLDAAVFKRVFDTLVREHEVFRTTFKKQDDEVYLCIHDERHVSIDYVYDDTSRLPADEYLGQLNEPFDLSQGPLLRVRLAKTADRKFIFSLCTHHILVDAWSMDLLADEIKTLYKDIIAGNVRTASATVRYRDFARWHFDLLQSAEGDSLREFWRDQLKGPLPEFEFPADYLRAPQRSNRGIALTLKIPDLSYRNIQMACSTLKVSELSVFIALVYALFHQHSRQEEMIIGTAAAGRIHPSTHHMIGFFVNILPLRLNWKPSDNFSGFLQAVNNILLGAEEHQAYPFDRIIEDLNIPVDRSRMALFDVMVQILHFENDLEMDSVQGLVFTPLSQAVKFNQFDLLFDFIKSKNNIFLRFTFNADLYQAARMQELLDNFAYLIEKLTANFHTPKEHLYLVHPAQQQQLLSNEIFDRIVFSQEDIIPVAFDKIAKAYPERTAISSGERIITYEELNRAVNRLAHYIRKNFSISPDTFIAVYCGRNENQIVSILAILKAGAAYLPLDVNYPEERTSYMLSDADAQLVLTDDMNYRQRPIFDKLSVIDLNVIGSQSDEDVQLSEGCPATSANLAYVIYTSGSTGNPKGVMVEHRNVMNLLYHDHFQFNFNEQDVWTLFHSICFDFSVWEIFGSLLFGGHLVVVPDDVTKNAEAFAQLLTCKKVSVLNQVPSAFYNLLPQLEKINEEDLNLRYIIFGGEALMPGMLRSFRNKHQDVRLINMYGITETTVHVTYKEITENDIDSNISNIGRPICNAKILIMDQSGRLMPPGSIGEIVVGGSGIARGYLNRPDLTRERFISNPYNPGEIVYKSGDLGMRLPHGDLKYVGRQDQQVKIRGFRIELGEIQNALIGLNGVKEAVVTVNAEEGKEKHLLAFLTPHDEEAFTIKQILSKPELLASLHHLPNGLPIYQVNLSETEFLYREIFVDGGYLKSVDINPGDTVIDVGANIGMFTIYIAALYHCKVHSIEPVPALFERLRANSELFRNTDIHVYNYAIGDRHDQVDFTYYPFNTVQSGAFGGEDDKSVLQEYLAKQYNEQNIDGIETRSLVEHSMKAERFRCPMITLSTIIEENNIDTIDLLKIDVEKSERHVLAGISAEHWKRIRQVIVEVQNTHDELEATLNDLKKLGFEVSYEQEKQLTGSLLYLVSGRRKSLSSDTTRVSDNPAQYPSQKGWLQASDLIRAVRNAVAKRLPHYMVPAYVYLVRQLPVTSNGKIDIEALRKAPRFGIDGKDRYQAPSTLTEENIWRIWKDVLGKEHIGVTDNFFEIGGHSLNATRIMSLIRKELGLTVDMGTFFNNPTIEALAKALIVKSIKPSRNIPSAPKNPYYPLSPAQLGMWVLEQYKENQVAYIIPGVFELTGVLDVDKLSAAFRHVVERHESLRTVFDIISGFPRQRILETGDASFNLQYIDIHTTPNAAAVAMEYCRQEVTIPFDLHNGPLLRVKLFRSGEGQYFLSFVCHHIISDGWSIDIIIQEVLSVYRSTLNNGVVDLAPLQIQYKDFAVWQLQEMSETTRAAHAKYWEIQLQDHVPLNIHSDLPRPAIRTFAGNYINVSLTYSESQDLLALCKQQQCSLYMVLLATVYVVLYAESGQEDIVVGSPIAGRHIPDTESVVGLFINSLPMRARFNSNNSFLSLLESVRSMTQEAYSHQAYPFDYLLEDLKIARDLSRTPLFDVWVVLQNKRQEDVKDLPNLTVVECDPQYKKSQFDLLFDFKEVEGQLFLHFEYNTDLYLPVRMRHLITLWRRICNTITQSCDTPVHEISGMSRDEDFQHKKQQYLSTLIADVNEEF
jgi:amino acid adenylation domain-containing protein/FkbM family methyltransferase